MLRQRRQASILFWGTGIIAAALVLFLFYNSFSLLTHHEARPFDVRSDQPEPNKNSGASLTFDSEPTFGEHFLTIAVDNQGSCPDKCMFLHPFIPKWVKWRYIGFGSVDDLNRASAEQPSHFLIVCRAPNLPKAASFARNYKSNSHFSVGLFHIADETNVEGADTYSSYDYVIRHYYFESLKNAAPGTYVRALGNLTCGTGPVWPGPQLANQPRLGLHWAFLPVANQIKSMDRSATSVWPVNRRPLNCVFVGSLRSHRAEMVQRIRSEGADLQCSLGVESKFGGSMNPWQYIHQNLARSKLGLNPFGNSPETHRLAELLVQGVVPITLDSPFLHVAFKEVPAVISSTWSESIKKMRHLLSDSGAVKLSNLQKDGATFYERLLQCQIQDLSLILQKAMKIEVDSSV